jgi:hypothetical protein
MNASFKSLCYYLPLLSILFACTQKEKTAGNETVTVDVSREYPIKKMLLQDIADVEYIRLETTDDMLWQGGAGAFTDRYIVNFNFTTGDILFFDKTGKGIKKINRKGESGEEYSAYSRFLPDEENDEFYISDPNKKKIFVYDPDGNFKRSFDWAPDKRYTELTVFDANRLIAYHSVFNEDEANSFLILSKMTGEIDREFILPQGGRRITDWHLVQDDKNIMVYKVLTFPILKFSPDLILTDVSSDTIFSMNTSTMERTPLIIQQPARATMDPEVFLSYAMESRNYIFLYSVEKNYGKGESKTSVLVCDKEDGMIYRQDIQNGDFSSGGKIGIAPQTTHFSASNKNVYLEVLQAGDLIEAYEDNRLKGKLKEIAAGLDEEDNPVLLVARLK